ncbi:MAG: AraC family transcriptional regulator [Pseudomonadota bacterium]
MEDLASLAEDLFAHVEQPMTGPVASHVPGVHIYRSEQPVPRSPFVYQSGIIICLSGQKRIYAEGRTLAYNKDNYLSVGLPLVLECETYASPEEPIMALVIDVDPVMLRDVAGGAGLLSEQQSLRQAVETAPLPPEMADAVGRLLCLLASPTDSAVLGAGTVREIVYRALIGPAGAALQGLLNRDGHTARVAEVMQTLNAKFSDRITIDEMARMAGMSASVFHRAFRQVTGDSPLQYLKKLRLTQASVLIVQQQVQIGTAANAVGYESASQFSRDFKSHFGVSAMDARRNGPNPVVAPSPD